MDMMMEVETKREFDDAKRRGATDSGRIGGTRAAGGQSESRREAARHGT